MRSTEERRRIEAPFEGSLGWGAPVTHRVRRKQTQHTAGRRTVTVRFRTISREERWRVWKAGLRDGGVFNLEGSARVYFLKLRITDVL